MKFRLIAASAVIGMGALAFAQEARADGADKFGTAGQLAISSDADIRVTNTSFSGGGDSQTTLLLRPAADYFVIDHLSVGGMVPIEWQNLGGGTKITTFGLGARAGYLLNINENFAFWPKGGFTFYSQSVSSERTVNGVTVSGSASTTRFQFNVYAPFLFVPAEHWFLGLGPELNIDLTGDDPKATEFGLAFTVGGWFLGD